ncbi:MAG: LysR family transcriptional regulator [Gammaproteobacteria bacterium]|jgi:DNA-binding transcriptional LysR family regulator
MDIDALQAFVAVAENQSFSQAAGHMFLTQPAISKRVASLESELDTRLFDRIGRKVELTESGQALLPRARNILLEIEDSRRAISNLSGKIGGKLSIGTSHHIGLHRLPPVLRSFTRQYPEVELDLHFMDSEEACRAVEHGDLELGIVTLPLDVPEDLHVLFIWPDPLAIVVEKHHPLTKQQQITLAELAEEPAILPTHGTYTREIIEKTIEPEKLQLNIRLATNYLETIKMMVSIGLGWSVLPCSMLNEDLVTLKVSRLHLERKLGAVWHQSRTLSNSAKAMLSQLQQTAKIS